MKKMVTVLLFGLFSVLLAGDYSVTSTGDSATCIAPPRNLMSAPAWAATNSVAQGVIRKNLGVYYMAVTAGTTGTNSPKHFGGIVSDGGVLWLRIPDGARKSLSIVQEASGDVWYRDDPAATNGGVYAFSKGQQYTDGTDAGVYVWTTNAIKFNVKDR